MKDIDIIQVLRTEHANMARLLDVLDRQVSIFSDGGSPDYDLLQAVVEYFLDYPDLCHHPKEDKVAQRMLEQMPAEASGLRGLVAQHEELAALTRRLATVVRRVLDEAELPRDLFIRTAREFLNSQRHHMQMEEEYFFPLAEGALSQKDLAELDSEIFRKQDPLFGEGVEKQFATLRDDILKWERAERET